MGVTFGQRGRMEQDCLGDQAAFSPADDTYAALKTNLTMTENFTYDSIRKVVNSIMEQQQEKIILSPCTMLET